jgi:hypothetical protein
MLQNKSSDPIEKVSISIVNLSGNPSRAIRALVMAWVSSVELLDPLTPSQAWRSREK